MQGWIRNGWLESQSEARSSFERNYVSGRNVRREVIAAISGKCAIGESTPNRTAKITSMDISAHNTEDETSAPVAELPSKAVEYVNTPDPKLQAGRIATTAPTIITDNIAGLLLYFKLCLVFMVLLLVVWCDADLPPNAKTQRCRAKGLRNETNALSQHSLE